MSLLINLRHLEDQDLELEGQLLAGSLDLELVDDLVHLTKPIEYDLVAQRVGDQILVQGTVTATLDCECVRCLKRFDFPIRFDPWICHLPLEGEEKIVVLNDCVDLTPPLREDILLEFPQHPLCETNCAGLPEKRSDVTAKQQKGTSLTQSASAWAELNKLKF